MPNSWTRRVSGFLCLGGMLAACTSSSNPAVPLGSVAAVSHHLSTPPPDQPPVNAGRLMQTYDGGYDPQGYSLGNYRMDPAPRSIHPKMTSAQVLDKLYGGEDASFATAPGARVIVRFGLFSGFDATSKNGTYGPTRAVVRRPAWLVVISGVLVVPHGGAMTMPGHTRAPQIPAPAWTLMVFYDDTGQQQSGVLQQGMDPHIT
jgi:hypothetical protein